MELQIIKEEWDVLSTRQRQCKILLFEAKCLEMVDSYGVEVEPIHHFSNGVYAREIRVPKGTALVGEIHLKSQLHVLSKGKVIVATDEGVRTLEAPMTYVSPAGVKRIGYVLEDLVWTTIHATDETDVDEIKKELIAPSYDVFKQLTEE